MRQHAHVFSANYTSNIFALVMKNPVSAYLDQQDIFILLELFENCASFYLSLVKKNLSSMNQRKNESNMTILSRDKNTYLLLTAKYENVRYDPYDQLSGKAFVY